MFACIAGKYGVVRGATSSDIGCGLVCPPGHFCNEGFKVPCPAGRFGNISQGLSESHACSNRCPLGQYGNVTGKTSMTLACTACPTGHYCLGNSTLVGCPAGRYGQVNQSSSLEVGCNNTCQPGYYGDSVGHSTVSSACKICGHGFWCAGIAAKESCPPGRYGSIEGANVQAQACPQSCPPGKFGNVSGGSSENSACPSRCPAGRFGNITGASGLSAACPSTCGVGKFGNVMGKDREERACPSKCPSGRYGNVTGASSVETACPSICPAGKFAHVNVTGASTASIACSRAQWCAERLTTGQFEIAHSCTVHSEVVLGKQEILKLTGRMMANGDLPSLTPALSAERYRLFSINQDSVLILRSLNIRGFSETDGGAIRLSGISAVLRAYDSIFADNTADQSGGVVFCEKGTVYFHNSVLKRSSATYGGAISAEKGCRAHVTGSRSAVENNAARTIGGAIHSTENSVVLVENRAIIQNNRAHLGGGISCVKNSNCTLLSRAFIQKNVAKSQGGGLFCMSSVCTMDNAVVYNNSAEEGAGLLCKKSGSTGICRFTNYAVLQSNSAPKHPGAACDDNACVVESAFSSICFSGFYGPRVVLNHSTFQQPKTTGDCKSCPQGRYGTIIGGTSEDESCNDCEKGYFCEGETSREICVKGRYGIAAKQFSENSCKPCELGYYCVGAASRSACPPGRYGNQSFLGSPFDCQECEEGYYCRGNTARTLCPPGKFGDSLGEDDCKNCSKGYFCTGGKENEECSRGKYGDKINLGNSSDCNECDRGSYCPGGNRTIKCAPGRYGEFRGMADNITACKLCPKGHYCGGEDAIRSCAPGKYGDEDGWKSDSLCKRCPTGYFCSGGAARIGCPKGKYSDQEAVESDCECNSCDLGKYSDSIGATKCTQCPPGYTNTKGGSASVKDCVELFDCPPGKYSGGNDCEECPIGKYNPTVVVKTTSEKFQNFSSNTPVSLPVFVQFVLKHSEYCRHDSHVCPTDPMLEYLFVRIDTNEDKKISAEEAAQFTFESSCLNCEIDKVQCNKRGLVMFSLKAGYWRNKPDGKEHPNVDLYKIEPCKHVGVCEANNTCKLGHKEELCAQCDIQQKYISNGQGCEKCDSLEIDANFTTRRGDIPVHPIWNPFFFTFVGIVIGTYLAYHYLTERAYSSEAINIIKSLFETKTELDVLEFRRELALSELPADDIMHIERILDVNGDSNISNYELDMGLAAMSSEDNNTEEIYITLNKKFWASAEIKNHSGMLYVMSEKHVGCEGPSAQSDLTKFVTTPDKITHVHVAGDKKRCFSATKFEQLILRNAPCTCGKKQLCPPRVQSNKTDVKVPVCEKCEATGITCTVRRSKRLAKKLRDTPTHEPVHPEKSATESNTAPMKNGRRTSETEVLSSQKQLLLRDTTLNRMRTKIIFDHLCVVSYLDIAFEIPWPKSVIQMLNFLRVFSLEIFDFLFGFATCQIRATWTDIFTIHMALLPIILLVLLLLRNLLKRCKMCSLKCCRLPCSCQSCPSLCPPRWCSRSKDSSSSCCTFIHDADYSHISVDSRAQHLFWLAVFVLYAGIATRIARVFKCTKVVINNEPKAFLDADMSIECYTSEEHQNMVYAAWGCLIVYVVGIPLYQGWTLYKHRHTLTHSTTKTSLGFFYRDYKDEYYWFEILVMIRRVILTALMVFLSQPYAVPQILYALIAGILWLCILIHWKPYVDSSSNVIAILLALQMILNLTLMLAMDAWKYSYSNDDTKNAVQFDEKVFESLFIATNGICLGIGGLAIVIGFFVTFEQAIHFMKKCLCAKISNRIESLKTGLLDCFFLWYRVPAILPGPKEAVSRLQAKYEQKREPKDELIDKPWYQRCFHRLRHPCYWCKRRKNIIHGFSAERVEKLASTILSGPTILKRLVSIDYFVTYQYLKSVDNIINDWIVMKHLCNEINEMNNSGEAKDGIPDGILNLNPLNSKECESQAKIAFCEDLITQLDSQAKMAFCEDLITQLDLILDAEEQNRFKNTVLKKLNAFELHEAVKKDDSARVEALLALKHPKPRYKQMLYQPNEDGETALDIATRLEKHKIIELLKGKLFELSSPEL